MTFTQGATTQALDVRRLQQGLNALGYGSDDGRALDVDGELGPRTRGAALKFQSERMPDPPTDGMIAPRTMMAIALYTEYLNDLEDSRHPCHELYSRARDGIRQLPPPCPRDEVQRDNVAAALAAAAQKSGLGGIDHVIASDDGKRVFAVEGAMDSPLKRVAEVSLDDAVRVRVEVSRRSMAECPITMPALAAEPAPEVKHALSP